MFRTFWRLLATIVPIFLASSVGWADERYAVSGMALSLTLPEGFEQGEFAPGVFVTDDTRSVVEVRLLAVEYFKYFVSGAPQVEAGFYKGDDNVTIEQIDLAGNSFTLFTGKTIIQHQKVDVWTALIGPYPAYSLVFSQSPDIDDPVLDRQRVLEILSSLTIDEPAPFAEQLSLVGLSISPEDPFYFNEVVNSQAVFMSPTKQSYESPSGVSATLVVVLDWDRDLSLGELERRDFRVARDLSREELLFAGADGSRIQATIDDPTGGPISLVQYMTVLDDRILVFAVQAPLEQMTPELEAVVDRMAASVELTN